MKNFRSPTVWQKEHQLALGIYKVTASMPAEERFLQMAMGSASEVEYQLLLAHDLNFISAEDYQRLEGQVSEVKKMLTSLMQKLRT